MTSTHPLKFVKLLFREHALIRRMVFYDIKMRYVGSAVGFFWGFITPLITIAVYWVVFKYGFKSHLPSGQEFGVWFIAGILPWFFFNDAVLGGCGAILEKPYLVQKISFKVELLPLIKVLASLFVHLVILAAFIIVICIQNKGFAIDFIGLIYHMSGIFFLSLGLALLTSSLTVFMRDVAQFLQVAFQLLFWLTPILWSYSMLPPAITRWLQWNPLACFVDGYRAALLGGEVFWRSPFKDMLLFWGAAFGALMLGSYVFSRLRPHFADVL